MGIKVVINNCYGGFGISIKCADRMKELGAKLDDTYWDMGGCADRRYASIDHDYPRHCPILVQVVEELGAEAAAPFAELVVCEISGDRYIIDEYDGMESVQVPEDIAWIVVQ